MFIRLHVEYKPLKPSVLSSGTHAGHSNTYCTPWPCLSWDWAAALLDHLTLINTNNECWQSFHRCTHAQPYTHTAPSARCISLPTDVRFRAGLSYHSRTLGSVWVRGFMGAQISLTSQQKKALHSQRGVLSHTHRPWLLHIVVTGVACKCVTVPRVEHKQSKGTNKWEK